MSVKQISLNPQQLIHFQQWKQANGDDFSLLDYLFGVANAEIAIAFDNRRSRSDRINTKQ